MAIPPEISKTIALIDAKVSDLQRAKASLLAAFGSNGNHGEPLNRQLVIPQPAGSTRKETLKNFLLTHGPAARAQIIEALDFPAGTAAYLLNAKHGFKRNSAGLWMVTEEEAKKN